jgi:hypothetical protein
MKQIITLLVITICFSTNTTLNAYNILKDKVVLYNASEYKYNNPDKTVFPAGPISWDEYGIYLTTHKQSELVTDDEDQKTLVMDDLIIDIQLLNRFQFTDTQLGQEAINLLASYDVSIAKAHGGKFNDNPQGVCGGHIYGNGKFQDDDVVVSVCCLLHPDTTFAFMVTLIGTNEQVVLNTVQTFGVNVPQDKKVR